MSKIKNGLCNNRTWDGRTRETLGPVCSGSVFVVRGRGTEEEDVRGAGQNRDSHTDAGGGGKQIMPISKEEEERRRTWAGNHYPVDEDIREGKEQVKALEEKE